MPYESFKCSHHVSIRGLVQDRTTGSWRYLIQVERVLQDDTSATNITSSSFIDTDTATSAASAATALWQRRSSSSSFAHTSPSQGSSHIYRIRRSFAEFKLLHAAMKPLMLGPPPSSSHSNSTKSFSKTSKKNLKSALPSLPVDSIFAFFLGETQTMLQKKRLALENILIAIENHSAASDSSEYLEFLAKTDTYEQVSRAPLSPPPCSLASTASTASSGGDDDKNETMSNRTSGFTSASRRHVSRPELLKRESTDDQRVPRRSQLVDDSRINRTTAEEASAPVARENRVEFHRYSLV